MPGSAVRGNKLFLLEMSNKLILKTLLVQWNLSNLNTPVAGKKCTTYGGVQLMEVFKKFSENALSQCKIYQSKLPSISNMSFCQYSTVNGDCRCVMQSNMIIELFNQ